jgi:cytochrome c
MESYMYRYVMLIVIAPLLILFSTACSSLLEPAATPLPDIPQVVRGETHYQTYCASCHEREGGIGPVLKKKVIATHSSAKSLFKYTKRFMPYGSGGALMEQEYWDITAYMLFKHGYIEEEFVLGPKTVEDISLKE